MQIKGKKASYGNTIKIINIMFKLDFCGTNMLKSHW